MSYEDQLGALAARIRQLNDVVNDLDRQLADLQSRHQEFYSEILSRLYKVEQRDTRSEREIADHQAATLFAGTVRAGSYDFSQGGCPPDQGSTQGHHGGSRGAEEGDTHEGSEA